MKRNKIEKRKKADTRLWLYGLVLPLTFIVWSLWPQPSVLRIMRVNSALLDPALTKSCLLLDQVARYDFEVKLPRRVWKSEQANLILTLRAPRDLKSLTGSEQGACSLAVETNLPATDLIIEPGETMIEPFIGQPSQSFVYSVSLRSGKAANGTLWIYAKLKTDTSQTINRLPLFSIPFQIKEASILGLPPALVRYLALLVMLILLAVFFRGRLREGR